MNTPWLLPEEVVSFGKHSMTASKQRNLNRLLPEEFQQVHLLRTHVPEQAQGSPLSRQLSPFALFIPMEAPMPKVSGIPT